MREDIREIKIPFIHFVQQNSEHNHGCCCVPVQNIINKLYIMSKRNTAKERAHKTYNIEGSARASLWLSRSKGSGRAGKSKKRSSDLHRGVVVHKDSLPKELLQNL